MVPEAPRADPATTLRRFDAVERAAHWLSALLFGVLLVTAIPLYTGSLFGLVLPRLGVQQVHLWSGVAFPVPFLFSVLGRWGRQLSRDVRRVNYWMRDEIAWLRSLGRAPLDADKFNPAQKLNAILVASSMVLMLVSGVILEWFSLFPVSWRGGATFVHDVGAWALVALIGGHVVMALRHPPLLASMVTGRVSATWAESHAPRWWREETGGPEERV